MLPWSERVRYGSRKNGYHGGATAQETVVPLLVLAPAELTVQGYEPAVIPLPFWWDPAVAVPAPRTVAPDWSVMVPDRVAVSNWANDGTHKDRTSVASRSR